MNIVKYDTPMGQYCVDDHLNIFFRGVQDFNCNFSTVTEVIEYIEKKISDDLDIMRIGLQAQIEMLQMQADAIPIGINASDYRITI